MNTFSKYFLGYYIKDMVTSASLMLGNETRVMNNIHLALMLDR